MDTYKNNLLKIDKLLKQNDAKIIAHYYYSYILILSNLYLLDLLINKRKQGLNFDISRIK